MNFEYSVYFRQNCIVPLLLIAFCIFVGVIPLFQKGRMSSPEKTPIANKTVTRIVAVLILLVLISANVLPLARGGIYLLFEKEKDQIEIVGTVDELFEIPSFGGAKYPVEQNAGKGEAILLGGEKYYLMTYGDLQIGDQIKMSVLPKSKFVLSVERINDET